MSVFVDFRHEGGHVAKFKQVLVQARFLSRQSIKSVLSVAMMNPTRGSQSSDIFDFNPNLAVMGPMGLNFFVKV